MNILFIGNSLTYYNDMPTLFENLAKENGKNVHVVSVTCGGRKLYEYLDRDDEYTKKIDELIETEHFDVCFLQEYTSHTIEDYQSFIDSIGRLKNKLKNAVDKFVLYETWGLKEGCSKLSELNCTNESMTKAVTKAYFEASQLFGMIVSPVGQRFFEVSRNHSEIELYHEDKKHPSYVGSCLAAVTHYETLFGESPDKYTTLKLPAATAFAFCE